MSSEAPELNTGIVIAGAYGDKVRRTLFAQNSARVKQDKEFAKEIARASAELNSVLYHVLVEKLGVEKGDAVRIRIKYTIDEEQKRIKWDYDSLNVELFKRVPEDTVREAVRAVLREKLSEILERFGRLMTKEEAERAYREQLEMAEKAMERPPAPAPPPAVPAISLDIVAGVDIVGELLGGGYLAKLVNSNKETVGLVTFAPSAEGTFIDLLLLKKGGAYRYTKTSPKPIEFFHENPQSVLEEVRGVEPTELSEEETRRIIEEKTESVI